MAPGKRLRVAVMLDGWRVSAWARAALADVVALDSVELALVVLNDGPDQRKGLPARLWARRDRLVYKALESLDERLFKRPGDALEKVDVAPLLDGVPVLRVKPHRALFTDSIDAADIERIRSHRVDVIVRMGFRILKGEILRASTHGVWSYHHGDNRINRGSPPGFWEVMLRWPVSGAVLQVLSERLDGGTIVNRCWSLTNPASPARNRNTYYWTSALMLARSLKRLAEHGPRALEQDIERHGGGPGFYAGRLFTPPCNLVAAGWLLRYLGRLAMLGLRRVSHVGQWYLAYGIGDQPPLEPRRFRKLLPPPDRFWADPHVIARDGRYYVFFEELPFRADRAHVSLIEIDAQGQASEARRVLEEPWHLSYPFVFRQDGTDWMIPESAQNRTIDLYRCVEFPHRWQREKTLMRDIRAADATLWFKDGKWWMFATVSGNERASLCDELHLFFADRYDSELWQPHPMNPLISDCRRARPAGALFERDSRLYRPSQNSSWLYGRSININEVLELSDTDYRERLVSQITPDWHRSVQGVHSLSQAGGMTMIDVFHQRRRF